MFAQRLLALVAAAALTACGNSTEPTGGSATSQLTLSFATSSAAPMVVSAEGRDLVVSDAQDTLVIASAQVVIRDVELWRVGALSCDTLIDDSCEKFVSGPTLIDLPLDGTVEQKLLLTADTGSYNRVEFDVHKVSNDDPEDADFRSAFPDFVGLSIRVTGTFNGQAFTYETDLNESQRFDLIDPIHVTVDEPSFNVTVMMDVSGWFRDAAGLVIDPATANKGQANENLVTDNIRAGIEAFEDRNRDGSEG